VARTEAYLHAKFHLDLYNRLPTIDQRHRHRTDRETGQDRQDDGAIAQDEPFYKQSPKNSKQGGSTEYVSTGLSITASQFITGRHESSFEIAHSHFAHTTPLEWTYYLELCNFGLKPFQTSLTHIHTHIRST